MNINSMSTVHSRITRSVFKPAMNDIYRHSFLFSSFFQFPLKFYVASFFLELRNFNHLPEIPKLIDFLKNFVTVRYAGIAFWVGVGSESSVSHSLERSSLEGSPYSVVGVRSKRNVLYPTPRLISFSEVALEGKTNYSYMLSTRKRLHM